MSRARITVAVLAVIFIVVLIIGYLQRQRTSQPRPHLPPITQISPQPLSTPLPPPLGISGPSASKPVQVNLTQKRPITATSTQTAPTPPEPCDYPAPRHQGWNAAAFGGDRLGLSCWRVPQGMIAVVSEPGIFYNSPPLCQGQPTMAKLPCLDVRDNRSVVFLQCLKQVVDVRVIGGMRLTPDPGCKWERENYR